MQRGSYREGPHGQEGGGLRMHRVGSVLEAASYLEPGGSRATQAAVAVPPDGDLHRLALGSHLSHPLAPFLPSSQEGTPGDRGQLTCCTAVNFTGLTKQNPKSGGTEKKVG